MVARSMGVRTTSVLRFVDQLVLGDPRHHRPQFGTDLFDRMLGGQLAGGLQFGLTGAVVEHETADEAAQIGRASCRERVCQYVWISVGAVTLEKTKASSKPDSK